MNYTIGISCILLAILILSGFLYVRRKRIKRSNSSDIDIPAFLRRENAGNNPVNSSDFDHSTRIHPWGKAE